jgi:cobalt/nickel transport system ATP-binding protein
MSVLTFDVQDATYRYTSDVRALANVTFQISPGQRVAILGANGCGKSTLLRLLAGLHFVESGAVRFCDQPLTEAGFGDDAFALDFRRRVGFLFQNPEVQLFNVTVFDEIAFGPLQLRWPRARILQRTHEMLELLDIVPLKERSPHRLSIGEKKRVALAATLALDPEVLLLDEPTAALDPQSRSRMIDFLDTCAGVKTIVTATHDLEIVPDIAERCLVLSQGRLLAENTSAEILSDEELLHKAHLIHAHRHRHANGVVHSHPHRHHEHDHPE